VVFQDKDGGRHGPPRTSQSETAVTVSDDGDIAMGKKKGVAQQMSSPPAATTSDTRKVILPPSTAEARVPAEKASEDNRRGTSTSPEAKAREQERIRQNWGMRFRTDEANSSLPRRGRGAPSFPRPWRGRGRAIPITHTYYAEEVRAERLRHPDNIVNKCRLREDRPASIVAIDEPLYPRSKRSTSVPEYVSKCADKQVSKGTEVQLKSLTSAKVLEDTADKELKIALAKYEKILKDYETLGRNAEKGLNQWCWNLKR